MFALSLITFLNCFAPPHDFSMAIFAITLEENTLQLKIKLDRGDIEQALAIESVDKNTTKLVADYVVNHTIWMVNNQPIAFTYPSIKKDDDFYFIEAQPIAFNGPFSTLEVYNTCLIEEQTKQSNIIYIKQKDKEMRGFRMNKTRQQISVDLK